jgi:hypothetical protein
LDVHLDFCEVALVEDGERRSAGRIAATPARIESFAGSPWARMIGSRPR